MTEEPQRFSFRMLRYIEPGSDSPWKEVFGTQSDGTHRPQYYSQLELPKVLELLYKYCTTWLTPEQVKSQAREALLTFTHKDSSAQVSSAQVLELLKKLDDVLETHAFEKLKVQTFKVEDLNAQDFICFILESILSSSTKVSSTQTLKLLKILDDALEMHSFEKLKVQTFKVENSKTQNFMHLVLKTVLSSSIEASSTQTLELLKILDDAIKLHSSENLKVQTFKSESIKTYNSAQFNLQTFLDSVAKASNVQVLAVTSPKSESVQVSASGYLVALYFIFMSAEGKALARVALKLYTTLNASGSVASTALYKHKKGFSESGLISSGKVLYSQRFLASFSRVVSRHGLATSIGSSDSAEVSSSKQLCAFKHQGSGASCLSQISLEYVGYGIGPYGYGLYGV